MRYVLQPVQGDEACMQLSWPLSLARGPVILSCVQQLNSTASPPHSLPSLGLFGQLVHV